MNLLNTCIVTKGLKMVPVSTKYAESIFKEFTQEVTAYMFPKSPQTINETLAFIHQSQGELINGKTLNVTILDLQSGEFLGGGGINNVNTKTPELGIWIKKGSHGHKYGREAVIGLKEWAEKHLTYDYLRYPVDKRNIASRKIPESLGGIVDKEYKKMNQSGNELDMVEYLIHTNAKSF